jgi:hypothetical protein
MKNWLIVDLDARTEAPQCSEETTTDRESLPEKESRHTEEGLNLSIRAEK